MALGTRRKGANGTDERSGGRGPGSTVNGAAEPAPRTEVKPFGPGADAKFAVQGPGEFAEVAELRSAVNELQSRVASLVERTGVPVDAADTASRIIVAANEAAELALSTAQAEADEIIEQAKAKSYEIIAVARELADQELAVERAQVAHAATAWNANRAAIAAGLASVESSLTTYQGSLSATVDAIAVALTQLENPPDPAEVPVADTASSEAEAPTEPTAQSTESTDAESAVTELAASADAPRATVDAATTEAVEGEPAAPKRSKLFGNGVASNGSAAGSNGSTSAPVAPAASAAPAAAVPALDDPPPVRAGLFGR